MINILRQLSKRLKGIFWRLHDEDYFRHPDKWCTICDGRIWWWQHGVRIYSLGMTRAHIKCAADYLRTEFDRQFRVLDKQRGPHFFRGLM